jgi:hypothetical protein
MAAATIDAPFSWRSVEEAATAAVTWAFRSAPRLKVRVGKKARSYGGGGKKKGRKAPSVPEPEQSA